MPTLRELVTAWHEQVRLHGPFPFDGLSFAELAAAVEAMGLRNWADALRGARDAERPAAARVCAGLCETMNRPGADVSGVLKLSAWPEFAGLPEALRAWAGAAEKAQAAGAFPAGQGGSQALGRRLVRAAPRTAGQVFAAGPCPGDRHCPASCYRCHDWGIILLCDHGHSAGGWIHSANPPGAFGGSMFAAILSGLPAHAPFILISEGH